MMDCGIETDIRKIRDHRLEGLRGTWGDLTVL